MRKRFLPKYTMISGTKWKVKEKKYVKDPETKEPCEGLCHYNTHTIEVSIKSNDELTIMTIFWHEVAHAIFHMSAVQTISEDAEHAVVGVLERYLAANVDIRIQPRKHGNVIP